MREKTLTGKWLWATAIGLFLAACAVKWYYVVYHHYYVVLPDMPPVACRLAQTCTFKDLLRQILVEGNYTFTTARPFFNILLHIFAIKTLGCTAQAFVITGILAGSLLVPLYFFVVRAWVNTEVAWAAGAILLWMTDYIYQSIGSYPVILGIPFVLGALLALIRYHQGGNAVCLYWSGGLLSMSVFCRFENALLVPAFVGYEFLFDRRKRYLAKIIYVLLSFSSCLWILGWDFHLRGDPFYVLHAQTAAAFQSRNVLPVSWLRAFEITWGLLPNLLSPLLWWMAPAGAVLMVRKYGGRALWVFAAVWIPPLFLIYKIKAGTLDHLEHYFFLQALFAIPLALYATEALFEKLRCRKIDALIGLGALAVFMIVLFHRINGPLLSQTRWRFSSELIRLTEDLKKIPASDALYIDYLLTSVGFGAETELVYLKRDPHNYAWGYPGREPRDDEYYLLTFHDRIEEKPKAKAVKLRDYGPWGFKDVALYRVTELQDHERK